MILQSFEQKARGQGAIYSKGELPSTPLRLWRCGAISVTVPHAPAFWWQYSGGVQSQEENPPAPPLPAPLPLLVALGNGCAILILMYYFNLFKVVQGRDTTNEPKRIDLQWFATALSPE